MNRTHRIASVCAVWISCLASSASVAAVTVLQFDEIQLSHTLPKLAIPSELYASRGILLHSLPNLNDSVVVVIEGYQGNGASSPPNALSIPGSALTGNNGVVVTFMEPNTGCPAAVDSVWAVVGDISSETDPITVTAYSLGGTILGTDSFVSPLGGGMGKVAIFAPGIHRVEFIDADPSGADIDDLQYSSLVTDPLCRPTPIAPESGKILPALTLATHTMHFPLAVQIHLPRTQEATLVAEDARGAKRAVLAHGVLGAGATTVRWDGRDTQGRSVPAGVYFLTLRTSSGSVTERIAVLRR